MIGGRWKDIEAGSRLGCKTIFINRNYKEKKPIDPNFSTDALLNAVHLMEQTLDK